MNETLQTIIALGAVGVAVAWLTWQALTRRRSPSCGGRCGCADRPARPNPESGSDRKPTDS